MLLRKTISALLISLLSFSFVLAQNVRQTDNAKQSQETQPDVEPIALTHLEKIVEQAQSLKLAENRIYIKATAADILWSRDEKRARALYSEAASELASVMSSVDSADERYYERVQWPAQLRAVIIERLAQRDPEMALDFLRATRQPPPPSDYYGRGLHYVGSDPETQLEARLASLIAQKDPKRSLHLAREIMKKGFSYELVGLLQNLRSRDKESYGILLKEILVKLQGMNLATNYEAASIAFNLLSILKSQEGEEEICKELVLALVSAGATALTKSANQNETYAAQNFFSSLRSHISEIEKYAPTQLPALKKKFADLDETLDPYTKAMNAFNQIAQNGTLDDMLEAAAKAPKEYRDQLYAQTMWKAVGQGDFQRAVQVAESDGISPSQRKYLLEQINRQRLYQLVGESKVDEVRQLLTSVKNLQESVQMLIQLAGNVASKGDKTTALQILAEANGLVSERPKNYAEMTAQLQIAKAYVRLDPERSFELTASFLPQLNDLVAAAATLNGFENNYLRDGEWALINSGGTVSYAVNESQQQIAELARTDFDRAVTLAESFQREEIRIKTLLLIAQTVLSENGPKRAQR